MYGVKSPTSPESVCCNLTVDNGLETSMTMPKDNSKIDASI